MDITWIRDLLFGGGTAQAVVSLALAVALGMWLGGVRVRGVGLGVGGVLFSSLLLGYCGMAPKANALLEFVREFGLILFVFTVGLQVGPSFGNLLRQRGMRLNLMATFIVVTGVLTTLAVTWIFDIKPDVAVGLFAGAVTNTPALSAAGEMFTELFGNAGAATAMQNTGMGYAIAYPFGIMGIILVMLLVHFVARVDVQAERAALEATFAAPETTLRSSTFEICNTALDGITLEGLRKLLPPTCMLSSFCSCENTPQGVCEYVPAQEGVENAPQKTMLRLGCLVHVEYDADDYDKLCVLIGREVDDSLTQMQNAAQATPVVVSSEIVVGKSLKALDLTPDKGVLVTRVVRGAMEFTPMPESTLHYGDKLLLIGTQNVLEWAGATLGNSPKRLIHPQVMPLFVGIVLGIMLGSIPVAVPGLPAPLKLGLAGGPLIMGIVLGRASGFCGMNWYMSPGANFMLREVGISLFLACVGLKSGPGFFASLADGSGFYFMGIAAFITMIPLLAAALVGRVFLKCNYASMCGLLAGSMTDPPALAFATQSLQTDAPASVYATVYPLTMLLRILAGQVLVLVLCSGMAS